jgi:DNA processing protein
LSDAIVAADPKLAASQADSNQILWIPLTLTPGLGPTRSRRLVEFFGSVDRVFGASITELEAAGLPAQSAQALGTGRSIRLANEEIARAAAEDVRLVAFDDPAYPSRLRPIYDPPLVLDVRGNVAALSLPGIAVVGPRHPTPYGTGMAERLACDLATRRLVIFSGLARGVDAAAHRAPSRAKARPVAMFGTGVDVLYPKENSRSRSRFWRLAAPSSPSSR